MSLPSKINATFVRLQELLQELGLMVSAKKLVAPSKAVIWVKWSKTMQNNNQVKLITVPKIPNSSLCPVLALSNLLLLTPNVANLPLVQSKVAQEWVPLTDSRVRRHFDIIFSRFHLNNTDYTLDAFWRSGASFAFNNEVALQSIQRHSTRMMVW